MTFARIALALTALLVASHSAVAFAQSKIGVVDMQRALAETEDGRRAKDTLKRLFEQRQKTLDKQQTDLKTLKDSLDKQRDVLQREILAKKLEEYQKAVGELQTTYVDFQRELAAKEGELTKPILLRMERVVRRIGQSDGYSLVVDRSEAGVIYVPTSYDLTDVLIQRYNAGEGRDPADAKPAAAAAKPAAGGAKPAAGGAKPAATPAPAAKPAATAPKP
jgi:outer membrane protein